MTISRTVRGILAFTGMPAEAFWGRARLTKSTYYNRISGETPWTATEVALAASALGVAVADLYEGRIPDGLPTFDSAVTHEYPQGSAVTGRYPHSDLGPGDDPGDPFPSPRGALDDAQDLAFYVALLGLDDDVIDLRASA